MLFSELLDAGIDDDDGDNGRGRHGERDQQCRDGGDDRPDDREPLQDAGDEGQDEGELPEFAEADERQDGQADGRGQEDRAAEQQLAAHPSAADPGEDAEQVLAVRPPRRRQRARDCARKGLAILEHEEEPDRDDDQAQHEGRGAQQRAEGWSDDALHDRRERLLAARDRCIDHGAQLRRQRQRAVPVLDAALEVADRGPQLRQMVQELDASAWRLAAGRRRSPARRGRPPPHTSPGRRPSAARPRR